MSFINFRYPWIHHMLKKRKAPQIYNPYIEGVISPLLEPRGLVQSIFDWGHQLTSLQAKHIKVRCLSFFCKLCSLSFIHLYLYILKQTNFSSISATIAYSPHVSVVVSAGARTSLRPTKTIWYMNLLWGIHGRQWE